MKKQASKKKEAGSGKDAFILGGGPSLKRFPLEKLRDKFVIGCNEAFTLGTDIVQHLIFSDNIWFLKRIQELEDIALNGNLRVYSVSPGTEGYAAGIPWLVQLQREDSGLHKFPRLGWNKSTGAAAINLAVNLGADRIFLLGFDLGPDDNGITHWHDRYGVVTTESSFHRHRLGFEAVARSLAKFAPDVKVLNVSPESKLDMFEKISAVAAAEMI
jgi:hypothetical protein